MAKVRDIADSDKVSAGWEFPLSDFSKFIGKQGQTGGECTQIEEFGSINEHSKLNIWQVYRTPNTQEISVE